MCAQGVIEFIKMIMENKDLFTDAVQRVNSHIAAYKVLLDSDLTQPISLEKIRSHLKADNVTIGQIYSEARRFFRDAKLNCALENKRSFKKFRDQGMSQGDAQAEADLETEPLAKYRNEQQHQRDMAEIMRDDIDEVCIDISVRLKNIRNDERY